MLLFSYLIGTIPSTIGSLINLSCMFWEGILVSGTINFSSKFVLKNKLIFGKMK